MSEPFSLETLTLMRRLRIDHHHKPRVYRELLLIDQLMHHYRAHATDVTGLGGPDQITAGSYLTTEQVAVYLGVKPAAVRRALREQRLKGDKDPARHREWRITPAALAEYRGH